MKDRLGGIQSWLGNRVVQILLGFQTAVLMWAVHVGNVWAMVICGFWWGWTLMIAIDTLLIQRDIKRLDREIQSIRGRNRVIKEMLNARERESLPVQGLWTSGPMH